MSEVPGYTPEDLIQTDGPNKGNIKDIELARAGAEAEKKDRSLFGRVKKYVVEGVTGHRTPSTKMVGEAAMAEEIIRRTETDLKTKGVSPAAAEAKGYENANEFLKVQNDLTQERIGEELNKQK